MNIITKQNIISGLKSIGIAPGMELEVHSSLKSFGYVEGGAAAVIQGFKETVGRCMFFDLRNIVDLYQTELKNNPYRLYGLNEIT